MLISREERKRKQRQRARKSRSQLLGPVAQGGQGRAPMRQGYTTTTVKPPEFQKPYDAGAGITQAGLAYKGGKGLRGWGEGGFKMPSGEGISDTISQYGTDVSNRLPNFKGLFTADPSLDSPSTWERFNRSAQIPSVSQGYNVSDLPYTGGGPLSTTAQFQIAPGLQGNLPIGKFSTGFPPSMSSPAIQGAYNAISPISSSFGQGLNLGAGIGSGAGGMQGIGHLGDFGGFGGFSGGTGVGAGSGAGGAGLSFGGGSTPFGSSLNAGGTATGSVQAGTSTAGAGLQSSGGQPWLAYANIGKDLIMGGPGSEKITGNTYGDAAIRAAAAYFTFGLSEIPYALF